MQGELYNQIGLSDSIIQQWIDIQHECGLGDGGKDGWIEGGRDRWIDTKAEGKDQDIHIQRFIKTTKPTFVSMNGCRGTISLRLQSIEPIDEDI